MGQVMATKRLASRIREP